MNSQLIKLIVCCSITLFSFSSITYAKDIVHDAEYYVLKAQHGDKWAAEDKGLAEKLAQLKQKFGTPPNIIHIMWDDTPFGEVGFPALQTLRGFSTPNINKLAAGGINFVRMYTEPSCTPSRAASMTGRHAVRNGMYEVGFPYKYGGLAESEVTIGEVLYKAGYATAFYGKWHLGDIEESYVTKQGFDEAMWTPYNAVPSSYLPQFETVGAIVPTTMYPEVGPVDPYDQDKGWRPKGLIWILEGTKDGPVREHLPPDDLSNFKEGIKENRKRTLAFIEKNANAKKPFYMAIWPLMLAWAPFPERETLSGGILQEALVRLDPFIGQMIDRLNALGISENTLIIAMADNGPMTHSGPPGMVETIYRGGKGDYLEGGVRVPAFASWPGMIEPGQIVGDIIHQTDLFTTFAHIAGATEHIPRDRIIDGVNQTSLLLNGDGHSRRDYVHIYTGDTYAATVKGRFKRHWVGDLPGLSGASFYDLYNDPREVQPMMLPMFPTLGMFNSMKARHNIWKEKYPDAPQSHGFPFTGVENARPETIAASKPRFNKDEVPYDVEKVMKEASKWETFEANWGIE